MWPTLLFAGLAYFAGDMFANKGFKVLTNKRYKLRVSVAKPDDQENARKYLEQIGFTDVDQVAFDPRVPTKLVTAGTWSRPPMTINLDFPALKLTAVEVLG